MSNDAFTPLEAHPWVANATHSIRFGVSSWPHPQGWRFFIDIVNRMEALGYDS